MPPEAVDRVIGELPVEVDEHGSGDVTGAECGGAVGFGERPAHIEHDGARSGPPGALVVESAGEFVGGDEQWHGSILSRTVCAKIVCISCITTTCNARSRNVSSYQPK